MRLAATACLAFAATLSAVVTAQQQPDAKLAFDVVSIKRHTVVERGGRLGFQPGGRFVMVNVTAAGLILTAYPTSTGDFVGAPDWVRSERFDIDARATVEPTREQEQALLRTLLGDRFRFAAHYESQERPVYNLVVARPGGRLGPQIRRIDVDCLTYKADPNDRGASGGEMPPCSSRMSGGTTLLIVSGGRTMQELGDSMQGLVGRPIVDKTGLSGYYAFTLDTSGFADPGPGAIFTAVQEQLGLKLESARAPINTLIVDRIERPAEN